MYVQIANCELADRVDKGNDIFPKLPNRIFFSRYDHLKITWSAPISDYLIGSGQLYP